VLVWIIYETCRKWICRVKWWIIF